MKFLLLMPIDQIPQYTIAQVTDQIRFLTWALLRACWLTEEEAYHAQEDKARCEEWLYWSLLEDENQGPSEVCLYPCAVCGLPKCSH